MAASKIDWQQLPLFSELTPHDLQTFEKLICLKKCPAHTALLNTACRSKNVYVIIRGRVKIYIEEKSGITVTLGFRKSGELIGEIGAIDNLHPSANVTAVETCDLLVIQSDDFVRCLRTMPQLSFNVLQVLTQRIRLATSHICALSTMNTRCRVARLLMSLATFGEHSVLDETLSFDSESVAELPRRLTQEDIADMVGSSRVQVNRVLMQLKREGILRGKVGQGFVISDVNSLRLLCD